MNDLATKAPPQASNAKRILNITMVLKFFGSIPAQLSIGPSLTFLASIPLELSIIQYANTFNKPNIAQRQKKKLVAQSSVHQLFPSSMQVQKKPVNAPPQASEIYPTMPQYPKILEMFFATFYYLSVHYSMIWVRADCSIGKNGPISVPVTEITPTMPMMIRTIKFAEYAQKIPVMSLRMAPIISVFLRPNLSALVVSINETTISPTMTAKFRIPISAPLKPLRPRLFIMTIAIIPQENIRRALAMKRSMKSLRFELRSRVIIEQKDICRVSFIIFQ